MTKSKILVTLALLLGIPSKAGADEKPSALICTYRITSADGTALNEKNGVVDGSYVFHLISCEVHGSRLSTQFIRFNRNMAEFKRARVVINGEKVPDHLVHINRKVQDYVLLEFPDVTEGVVNIEVLTKVGTSP
jgi:hypothetical protein